MAESKLEPIGVVFTTRNQVGEHNSILVYASPYGFKVLEGPGVNTNDPLIDKLENPRLKIAIGFALQRAVR